MRLIQRSPLIQACINVFATSRWIRLLSGKMKVRKYPILGMSGTRAASEKGQGYRTVCTLNILFVALFFDLENMGTLPRSSMHSQARHCLYHGWMLFDLLFACCITHTCERSWGYVIGVFGLYTFWSCRQSLQSLVTKLYALSCIPQFQWLLKNKVMMGSRWAFACQMQGHWMVYSKEYFGVAWLGVTPSIWVWTLRRGTFAFCI